MIAFPAALAVGDARVALHATDRPAALDALAPDERCRALRLAGSRRHDYLLGRAALRQALAVAGLGRDTASIAMPNRHVSLTHGGGIAVAAWCRAAEICGVGVDWEPLRAVDPAAARFFLSERESAAASAPDALLRLWTVKEALYKATPDNAALSLRMFALDDPVAETGAARLASRPALAFRYATRRCGGFLTAAVALDGSAIARPS